MKKSMVAALMLSVAGSVGLPGPASAASLYPSECTYQKADDYSSIATCKKGHGHFRAVLYCKNRAGTVTFYYGRTIGLGTTWTRPGMTSMAYCQGDSKYYFSGIELIST